METHTESDKFQELDELKNTFVALASHELRTPMNLVQGYLEMGLEALENEPDQAREYLDLALKNSKRMMRIVQELTDFARLSRGREITDNDPTSIGQAFQETWNLLKPDLDRKAIDIIVQIEPYVLDKKLDADNLIVIFRNILSNAAKFSPEKSSVLVKSERNKSELIIGFHDQAVPIPENKRETIFQDFRQLENYLTRRYEGMGLGLAVARRTARLLGGDIKLKVRKNGNSFFVILPDL
jgi:signal transduction histidine kinase